MADGVIKWQACPCCGAKTFAQRFVFDICPVCGWEDDYDTTDTSSNHMSLEQAQANFRRDSAAKEHWRGHVITEEQWELAVDMDLVYIGDNGERHYRANNWVQQVRAAIPSH